MVDNKNNKVKFKIIPKTNEEFIFVTHGCIKFFDSFRCLSSSLDKLVGTLVDNSHKSQNILKTEIEGDDIILNIVNQIEKLIGKVGYYRTIENLKKVCPDEIEKLTEGLFNYIGENDPEILKTEHPDNWKNLT